MSLRKTIFVACLLTAWTASSAQLFVINGDSLYCYSQGEIRAIADKLIDLESCQSEYIIMQQEIDNYRQAIQRYESVGKSYATEINIRNTMIETYQTRVTDLESDNRQLRTKMTAGGIIVGILLVLSLLR